MTASSLRPVALDDVTVAYGARTVISDLSLTFAPGRRTALVGENGSGKSTLLHAVAQRLPKTAVVMGTITAPKDLVMVGQEPPFRDEWTVAEVRTRTLAPLQRLLDHLEILADHLDDPVAAQRHAQILERAVATDAWDAGRRAQEAAERLGLGGLDETRPVGALSGGQRMRLALAGVMTTRPSAVLLDEPTNHLDDDALGILTEFLTTLPGVVLVASHDRVLLDEVCTDLVDLDPSEFGTDGLGGRRFNGGWSVYETKRNADRARWEQTWLAQQDELRELRRATQVGESDVARGRGPRDNDKFVHSFKGERVQSAVARRRRDAERRLAAAEAAQVAKPRPVLHLSAPVTTSTGASIRVRDLRVDDDTSTAPRLSVSKLDVAPGEHLLVTGGNGVGKSTLLGVLSGRIAPSAGTVDVAARRVAELEQDVHFEDPSRSPAYVWEQAFGEEPDVVLRELGLVRPADLQRPIGLLSVGQRRRLGLALVLASRPDLLLLDEPTNHLSLGLASELEDAVGESTATIVVASHDRWLRRRWDAAHLRLEVGSGRG
ncbi:ABC-F family ATP-binding cassette domain-containing protein [Nocardioides yefusunii]|uniref:ABC-F family ATP-binding cassette domain-containing protein n=1 Tax=Nocardioides yefusunii TaxID=2500546 RepID=A0ABW1QUH3_9ACTN|nr:ATP-binding cassette domain-containing protein [Nocardioides yefusunii]